VSLKAKFKGSLTCIKSNQRLLSCCRQKAELWQYKIC